MSIKIAILSDVHANLTALNAIINDLSLNNVTGIFFLGDLINYGPRPNETIEAFKVLNKSLLVNIWGNHEYSIFGGALENFATNRGRSILKFTNTILTPESRTYLDQEMEHNAIMECEICDKLFLCIHGTLDDPYWGRFTFEQISDDRFAKYDYVITGHSHIPHYIEHFYSDRNTRYRNKKRTIFINPGSVGQPRNHNPYAQYGILDILSGNYEHRSVLYDIEKEQALYTEHVDSFYKERLTLGV